MTYEQMSRYLEHLSVTSDRVRLRVYGATALARKTAVLTVSAPANLARLDRIYADLGQLAAGMGNEAQARALAQTLPVSVWIGYGTHADELSGPDAAMRLLDRLATGKDAQTLQLLESLLIHVDPMVNPDGRERFLTHITTFQRRVPVLDAQDIVRHEFWPPTRFNHYLFDLNRDALYLTQAQSAARVAAIHAAYPQVFVDAHEMSYHSTFLFALPADPLNPYLPAPVHRSWQRFGADLSRSFDAQGASYYTRSWNEVFYPGYYDILPAYSGITPLLYEQARTHGVGVMLPNGRTRSFSDAVANQLQSSLATLQSAAHHRVELFDDWLTARREAVRGAGASGPKAWIVPFDNAFKIERLTRILQTHRIAFEYLATPVRASGLHSVWSTGPQTRLLPVGSLLVRTSQPTAGLIRNLFDFHVPMDEAFLRAERQRTDLRRKTQIYDITAWSLPLAFDLPAYWSAAVPAGDWRREQPATAQGGALPPAGYGYLYEDPSLYATARLLDEGVKVRVATEPFERGGRSYPSGTLLVRKDDHSQDLAAALATEASRSAAGFHALDSARIHVGPDLGDDKFALLEAPRIAILAGNWSQATSVGALWQMFDEQIGIAVTLLDLGRLAMFDLSRYNVLILPDAEDPAKLAGALSGGPAAAIKAWIQTGGTFIAQGGGTLAASELGLTTLAPRATLIERFAPLMLGRSAIESLQADLLVASGALPESPRALLPQERDKYPVIGKAAAALLGGELQAYVFPRELPTFAQWADGVPEPERLQHALPQILRRYLPRGAYLRADLKAGHWLRYGVEDRLPVLFREQDALLSQGPAEIVGRYAAPRDLVLSGLVWPEAVGYIAGTAYLVREKHGRGQFIGIANDATFRGYSLGTQRLLLNAAILGPGMRSD